MNLNPGSQVLVVDDDKVIRFILQAMLEAEGYAVVCAENGLEALKLLSCEHPSQATKLPFELVVLDVMMPHMSGLEMLQEVRKDARLVGLPVLMLTAEASPEDEARGYAAGADFFMAKPFDRRQLLDGVSAALLRHHSAAKGQTN
jgi:DNA-binding response OmpR family regulator